MSVSYACPTCDSDNVQRVSLAYANGVSVGGAVSIGGARSSSGGILGGAATGSISSTLLSSSLAPPAERPWLAKLVFSVIFLLIGVISTFALFSDAANTNPVEWMLDAACFSAACWIFERFHRNWRFNQRVLPRLVKSWSEEFICLRCSKRFYPAPIVTPVAQANLQSRVLEGEAPPRLTTNATSTVPTFGGLATAPARESKINKIFRRAAYVSFAFLGCVLLLIWLGERSDQASAAPATPTPIATTNAPKPSAGSSPTTQDSGKSDRRFSECLQSKAEYGEYSSFDGGKSAGRLLEDCGQQFAPWEESCEAHGTASRDCGLNALIAAQAAIKQFGK